MNQCANARAVSPERCKRTAQSPPLFLSFPSPGSFDLPFSLFLLSNYYLSLIFTNTVMFTFHFSLTNSFSQLIIPSCSLLSYLFISFSAVYCTHRCHHFYFPPLCFHGTFPCALPDSLSTLTVSKENERKKKVHTHTHAKKRKERKTALQSDKNGETRGEGRRVKEERLKAHYFPFWGEKMSEGAIIKLEFFNTVKNGALTAHRQCKGQAPTTHGEPPN